MSNAIFFYDLKPIPLAVYSYLACCAGQKDLCWPASGPSHCNCSENAARDAVKQLAERGFIRKVATKRMRRDESWRQSNDHYYILPLPALPTTGYRTSKRSAAGDPVKNGGTRFSGCRFEFANKLITLPGWDGY